MKQELLVLQWRSPLLLPSHRPCSLPNPRCTSLPSTVLEASAGELTAKERRQLRKERRESKAGDRNWREEVEERLMVKPKKEYKSWTEKLNLDLLAKLGTQWWVIRVSRINGHETAEVYYPAVKEQRKLKNGSISVKLKPLFPGCVFLNCVMNKEIHDFIREVDRVGGFVGSKVGNTKRQINKPKPVPVDEMEAIFQQAKEEQEKSDQAFKEEQHNSIKSIIESASNQKSAIDAKPKRKSRRGSDPSKNSQVLGENSKSLVPGSSVRVLSGPFAEFSGRLKELDPKNGKASVGFMLFGKESIVEIEVEQIVADTT
ncbi:uncharacterized protein LOC109848879 isoform X2 [Asparagus officinalis]|uniref:uncharacterized protein LOC109848879 isoform X2 n=1 Tax=Asparagus officinalis TaxID=4686 RepID=UPI00098E2BC6|nr:uncharacterized protein LOC109848879 isoform X2 [Asparagus officinalis]